MGEITAKDLIEANEKIKEAKVQPLKIIGTKWYLKNVLMLTDKQISEKEAYGMEVVSLEGKCNPKL